MPPDRKSAWRHAGLFLCGAAAGIGGVLLVSRRRHATLESSTAVGSKLIANSGVTIQHRGPDTGTEQGTQPTRAQPLNEPISQTPQALVGFPALGLSDIGGVAGDPQIAVSTKFVVVTARNAIAIYSKTGTVVRAPQQMVEFFRPLSDDLHAMFGITAYFDARAIFDPFRRRFWVGAMAEEPGQVGIGKQFVIAVSKTENPGDGWYAYWWDSVGQQNPQVTPNFFADYPCLGIDAFGIYQTNGVDDRVLHTGGYWHVVFFPADELANGVPGPIDGWQYWDLKEPNGAPAEVIQPVVHHGATPRTYFASRNHGTQNQLLIWALTGHLTPDQRIDRLTVTFGSAFTPTRDAPQRNSNIRIRMTNLDNDVLKAVYRDNRVYVTCNDAKDWDDRREILTSIRLVRLNVTGYATGAVETEIDRTFGARNPIDDHQGEYFYYAWPAVEVNRFGDMLIGYSRSGSTIFPEMRATVYFSAAPDVLPSRLLKTGEDHYEFDSSPPPESSSPWGDTSGACVDPTDDTAIWLAHQFAVATTAHGPNNFDLWVAMLSLDTVPVPDCGALSLANATGRLQQAGLQTGTVRIVPQKHPGRPGPLVVVDQTPDAAIEVNRGTTVDLSLAR